MSLEIRRATESDLPGILRMYGQPSLGDGADLPMEAATKVLRRIETYPDYHVFVAAQGGELTGTFALLIMDNLAHQGAPSAVVEDVCVDEGHQRSGIGRAMMEFAMKAAVERGCYKLTLSSNLARASAHDFYRSLGFEQHGLSFRVNLGTPSRTAD